MYKYFLRFSIQQSQHKNFNEQSWAFFKSITVPVKQILFVAVLHSEPYRPSHSTQRTFQTSLSTVCTTRKTSLFLTKIRWLWSREPICRESWILLFAYPAARWLCSLHGPHGGGGGRYHYQITWFGNSPYSCLGLQAYFYIYSFLLSPTHSFILKACRLELVQNFAVFIAKVI